MGPLVPDIIGNELNLIVALFIGILFGAILEQAGFSTSKKLVGLFYGYDFTVLRVFFTAGVVAMGGVIILEHFGMLDINLIYINPTFLWSAIIGGLIMGLGFVVGGFCPGTSVCAAAIGKIDAIIFIAGSFLGVLVFAEGYPLFENLYKAEYWGNVRIFDTLGLSQSVFAFLLTAMALGAFWFVSIVENNVNGVKKKPVRFTRYYASLAALGIVISLSAFIFPERKSSIMEKTEDVNYLQSIEIKKMTIDELAYRIIDNDKRLQLFDFRTPKEAGEFSLPKSYLVTVDNLFEKDYAKILNMKGKLNIIIANDESSEKKIAVIANELGSKNLRILQGGLIEFKNQIINYKPEFTAGNLHNADTNRFRLKASQLLPELIEKSKGAKQVKKESKRVVGGC